MSFKKAAAALVISGAAVLGLASPAFAHDCFNPNKPATAGAHYRITGFGPQGPILEPIEGVNGKGKGGTAIVNLTVFGGPDIDVAIKTLGNGTEVAGGPGSAKADHACDGHGIDLVSVCFAGPPA